MANFHSSILSRAMDVVMRSATIEGARADLRALGEALQRGDLAQEVNSAGRARGRSFYERLTDEILLQVKSLASREELLDMVIGTLVRDSESQTAKGYLILRADLTVKGQISNISVQAHAGFNDHRVRNFIKDNRIKLAKSPMIEAVLIQHEALDLVATSIVSGYIYNGEFDDLVDDVRRGVWVGLQPLPAADAGQPSRMLVALYPNTGSPSQPDLPRGARQEWRVFALLRVCYEVLNHQLATASERLAAARRELMVELAAPLVNHEINQQMAIMAENMNLLNQALHGLAPKVADGDPDFATAARALGRSYDAIQRVRAIADAFNNLEKRNPNIEVTPRLMIRDCFILMHPRFARAGLAAGMAGDGLDVSMRTDPTLVEHVLLNLLINAVEAIQAEQGAAPDPKIRIEVAQRHEWLVFTISNNGPPIEMQPMLRIFERGMTTKPHNIGHGMGLYLCRLVARYLGGTIDVVEPSAGFAVAFQLELPIIPTPSEDIFVSKPAEPAEGSKIKHRRSTQ